MGNQLDLKTLLKDQISELSPEFREIVGYLILNGQVEILECLVILLMESGEGDNHQEAIKVLGVKSFMRARKDARMTPFEETFKRLSLREALNVYAIANPVEKKQVRNVLKGKYDRAKNITPEMMVINLFISQIIKKNHGTM